MKELHIITDLQYGSTGKGLFAGYLAAKVHPDTIITAWAPNAGHTFMDEARKKYVTCALPSGIFTAPNLKRVLLGPGSVINPELLLSEIGHYAEFMDEVDLIIHPNAAVVNESHRILEARGALTKIGSTLKGVAEANIQKMRRDPMNMNIAATALMNTPLEPYVCSVPEYNDAVDSSKCAVIEGAQGFSLSINHGFYPYTTSRDCTTTQLLSDCAVPPQSFEIVVYGVCRTFPIRVNNRDGYSGPSYGDQEEIQWSQLDVEPELTTVTKLPRRIFTFSEAQIMDAVRMNGVNYVFLNFANYAVHAPIAQAGSLTRILEKINKYAPVEWLGYGPSISDIIPSNAEFGGEVGKFAGIDG